MNMGNVGTVTANMSPIVGPNYRPKEGFNTNTLSRSINAGVEVLFYYRILRINRKSFKSFSHWTISLDVFVEAIFFSSCSANILRSSTGPRSAVGNVSGNRCESDCRSVGREFDPGPVPYFRGD